MTTKLKSSDSYFIQIDVEFATKYGLNEATLAGKLLRLLEKLTGAIDDDGNKWIRLTLNEWLDELPFMKEMTLRRTIESLEEKGILLSRTFSGRSKWYRLNPEFVDTGHNVNVQKEQIHYDNCSNCTDATVQNEQIEADNCDVSVQNEQLPITTTISNNNSYELLLEPSAIIENPRDYTVKQIKTVQFTKSQYDTLLEFEEAQEKPRVSLVSYIKGKFRVRELAPKTPAEILLFERVNINRRGKGDAGWSPVKSFETFEQRDACRREEDRLGLELFEKYLSKGLFMGITRIPNLISYIASIDPDNPKPNGGYNGFNQNGYRNSGSGGGGPGGKVAAGPSLTAEQREAYQRFNMAQGEQRHVETNSASPNGVSQ